jgi:FkbM family methyltransferase
MFLKRINRLVLRRLRARQLGFHFRRVNSFEIPKRVRLFGEDVTLCVPPQPTMKGCFIEVLMDDSYGLSYLRDRNIQSVLDIGGNIGFFALAAREAFPGATIHVYEPNPAAIPYLESHSHAARFEVFPEAVGAAAGHVTLTAADFVNVRSAPNPQGDISQVPFRQALERIGGRCDLVKLDCEGAEWEILSQRESWQQVDHLAMEYHFWNTDYKFDDVPQVLGEIGFKVRKQFMLGEDFGMAWASRLKL